MLKWFTLSRSYLAFATLIMTVVLRRKIKTNSDPLLENTLHRERIWPSFIWYSTIVALSILWSSQCDLAIVSHGEWFALYLWLNLSFDGHIYGNLSGTKVLAWLFTWTWWLIVLLLAFCAKAKHLPHHMLWSLCIKYLVAEILRGVNILFFFFF